MFDKYDELTGELYPKDKGWGECSYFGQEFFGEGCCRQYQSRDFHEMMSRLIMADTMRIKKSKVTPIKKTKNDNK